MRSSRRSRTSREEDPFAPAGWVSLVATAGRFAEASLGRPLMRLDERAVSERVARRIGHAIQEDDPGLRVLLADAAQAGLTPLGRAWLQRELVRRDMTRELLADEIRRCPEILDTPLRKPIVVVGLPRTGTTLLHALLGCDPDAAVFSFWQLRRPHPPPSGPLSTVRRVVLAASIARLAHWMAPRLSEVHPLAALRPEEDVFLLRNSGMLATALAAPGYLRWLQEVDPVPDYRLFRRHLLALLHERPHRRVVLKSPFHLGRLDALLTVLPQATVVHTHRDPAIAVASWCSLAAVLTRASSERVDLAPLGRRWLDFWAAETDRAVRTRAEADPARFHDVQYQSLVADPMAEIERLYAGIGLQLHDRAGRRMSSWLRRHHQQRVSPHRYSLADFALDSAEVGERFARYREWASYL